MKITKQETTNERFNPYDIIIRVETREEEQMLKDFGWSDIQMPKVMEQVNRDSVELFKEFQDNINSLVRGSKNEGQKN